MSGVVGDLQDVEGNAVDAGLAQGVQPGPNDIKLYTAVSYGIS